MGQKDYISKVQMPIVVRQNNQLSLPTVDDTYFDKLAAFGLACVASAIVGKLLLEALTPHD